MKGCEVVEVMRPEISAALDKQQWVVIREMEAVILEADDLLELRALALAKLYTGAPADAVRLFRLVKDQLDGVLRAACLVDGATAMAWCGEYPEALVWLAAYFGQPQRAWDAAAHETRGYCLWKLRRPIDEVDRAYSQAVQAFGSDEGRIARTMVLRARLHVDAGLLDSAEALLSEVAVRTDVAGYVLSCRARIAAKRHLYGEARRLAFDAIQTLQASVDRVGSTLESIARMALLLAELNTGSERIMWVGAVKGLAVSLQMPQLYNEAEALEGSTTYA